MGNSTVSKSRGPDVYQIVTDKILELLDKGTIPWHKPWKGGFEGIPKNAISKKPWITYWTAKGVISNATIRKIQTDGL